MEPNVPRMEGVESIDLNRFEDSRGSFVEIFRTSWLPSDEFVQSNISVSKAGVLRGLHYHLEQVDLWTVVSGSAVVALVDLRAGSPTRLDVDMFHMVPDSSLRIPSGVAHGFYAETDLTLNYMVTAFYDGSDEYGVAWNDSGLAVPWPDRSPILSDRDRANPVWSEVPDDSRPGAAS